VEHLLMVQSLVCLLWNRCRWWTFQRWFQGWFPCRWIVVPTLLKLFVAELIRCKRANGSCRQSWIIKRWFDAIRILPQAFKNIWPALGNEFISLIKESSIVSIIGVTDLIYQLNIVRADTYSWCSCQSLSQCCCTLSWHLHLHVFL